MTRKKDTSPHDFYAAFRKVVDPKKADLPQYWTNSMDTAYTALMLGDVLSAVARELSMNCYGGGTAKNYYLLDGVLYHDRDELNFKAEHGYVKYISVALEHENVPSSAHEEMNKLQLFNVPLTVLITCPAKSKIKETLDKYATIIQQADILENASTTRRQLAIFGYKSGEWEAFVFHDGGFVPVVPAQALAAGEC